MTFGVTWLDNSGAILKDLSPAYDCFPQYLLIERFEAYGLDKPSVNLVSDYFSFQKQSTKIGFPHSD